MAHSLKKCRVVPKKCGIPDILPNKRIFEPMVLELNKKEVRRAMSYAEVSEILSDNSEIPIDEENFNDDNSSEIIGSASNPIIPDMPDLVTTQVTGIGTAGIETARFY